MEDKYLHEEYLPLFLSLFYSFPLLGAEEGVQDVTKRATQNACAVN